MIEMGLLMHLAIMDVDGGKEKPIRLAAWKRKCHGMSQFRFRLKFKHRKSVIGILWKFVPCALWQSKARIEPIKVFDRRDKRSVETADRLHFEFRGKSC